MSPDTFNGGSVYRYKFQTKSLSTNKLTNSLVCVFPDTDGYVEAVTITMSSKSSINSTDDMARNLTGLATFLSLSPDEIKYLWNTLHTTKESNGVENGYSYVYCNKLNRKVYFTTSLYPNGDFIIQWSNES